MPNVKQETTNQATTTSHVSLLKAQVVGFLQCSIVITNSHGSNSLKWKILTSNDQHGSPDTWAEEKAEATLTAGSADKYTLSGVFCWVDIQVVDATGGQHATANCWLQACGL